MVSVYNSEDLNNELSVITDKDENVINFYKNFVFESGRDSSLNSTQLFKDSGEESNSSKIIQLLNKIQNKNINKTISSIRDIHFKSVKELQDLVNQCIQKIKRENEQIKPLVGTLCYELLSIYCIDTIDNSKVYFRKLLLTSIKNEYFKNINYSNEQWHKDHGIKSMTLIGTLYNCDVVANELLLSIFDDFKKCIIYNENKNELDFNATEKSIQLLVHLSSTLIMNDNIKEKCEEMNNFIKEHKIIYDENKKISKKSRLEMCSCIDAFEKLF
jgi:hypothetical protein